MRECIDEGILQSYFDGELSSEKMESVASHLAVCISCARAVRELESESLLLSKALEPEFTGSVPTERLRHRLDAAIAGLHVVRPIASQESRVRTWLQSISDLSSFPPQRAFGYAGLAAVIVFAAIFAIVQWRNGNAKDANVAKVLQSASPVPSVTPDKSREVVKGSPPAIVKVPGVPPKKRVVVPARDNSNQSVAKVKLLPGERSYLKQIASLDTTIKSESSRPMRPGLQAEYERNLALVDRAIAATRSAAKSNPNDPDAAEFMFAAYQSKVDLLNQVADARLSNRPR
jgi:anti-sigma factor RsiW